jgi:glycosyltransferase involved in cell wall biosynthesis
MQDNLISVIIRFHHEGEIAYLSTALKSLSFQTYKSIQAVLVLQNCTTEIIENINSICTDILLGNKENRIEYKILNFNYQQGQDARCRQLNKGLDASEGEYIAFLDYDDIVYQNCYELLINQCNRSGLTLAAGGTVKATLDENKEGVEYIVKKEPFLKRTVHFAEFFYDNFLPIHSFVISRKNLPENLARFDESFTVLEDYSYLLRIASEHKFDLTHLSTPICEYRFRNNRANTTQLEKICDNTAQLWSEGRSKLEILKSELNVTVSLSEIDRAIAAIHGQYHNEENNEPR